MSVEFDIDLGQKVREVGGDVLVEWFSSLNVQDIIVRFKGFHFRGGLKRLAQEDIAGVEQGIDVDKLTPAVRGLVAKPWDGRYDEVARNVNSDTGYALAHNALKMKTWFGDVRESKGSFPEALAFVKRNFDPRGKLIVVGESLGGWNAIQFCNLLAQEIPYYRWFDQAKLEALKKNIDTPVQGQFTLTKADPWTGKARVDLLVTLDAAFDKATYAKDSKLPDIVARNINYYQEVNDPSEKHGRTTSSTNATNARDEDQINLTVHLQEKNDAAKAHDECIHKGTVAVMAKLQEALKSPPPANVAKLAP